MTETSGEPQSVRGQWGPAPPGDFVALVAAVTAIGVDVKHVTEDVRDQRRSLDSFIVEHRTQHLDDRKLTEGQVQKAEASVKESVKEQLGISRKVYVGLLTSIVLLLIADIVVRLLG